MTEPVGDEDAECRICRSPAELPQRPLLHPCRCSGSIRYTHEDCLVNWLAQSNSLRCELCHHPFRFEPVYRDDTPQALPADELVLGLVYRARMGVLTAARVALVVTVWLFLLPLGTCWTWYALFINALSQLPSLIASRGLTGVVTDAFYGCLLSAGILFVFLGVSSLREYIRHIPDEGFDHHAGGHALHDAVDEDDGNEHQVHHHPEDHDHHRRRDRAPAADQVDADAADDSDAPLHSGEEAETAQREGLDGTAERRMHFNDAGNSSVPAGGIEPDNELQGAGESRTANVDRDVMERDQRIGSGLSSMRMNGNQALHSDHQSISDDDQLSDFYVSDMEDEVVAEVDALARDVFGDADRDDIDDENAIDAAQQGMNGDIETQDDDSASVASSAVLNGPYANDLYRVDDVQEEDVGGAPDDDAGDDMPGDEHVDEERGFMDNLFPIDPDDAPIDEMIGLRGPLRNLFDNAGTVLVSNAIFLGIFTLIPLLVGRLALRIASLQKFPYLISASKSAHDSVGDDAVGAVISIAGAVGANTTKDLAHLGSSANASNAVSDAAQMAASVAGNAEAFGDFIAGEPIVSYIDNLFIVLLGYGVISLAAFGYVIVNSLLRSRYPRLDTPMTRQVVRALRYTATFVKIVVLIIFEFGVFPLGCGWWLDVCTLDIVGSTLGSRSAFCREFPWTCTAGHWFIGIFYMVHVSLFVSLLREVLRPELLWFLRNPDDPEFHPFRELVEKPLSRHARRMCLSMFIYVPLILAVVYVPGQICLTVLPNVFPFQVTDFSRSFVEVPFGNLLIVPLMSLVHHARPGSILRGFIRLWIEYVGDFLGIAHLVARDEDNDDTRDDRGLVDGGDNDPDVNNFDAEEDFGVFAPLEAEELDVDLHEEDDGSGEVAALAMGIRDVDGPVTPTAVDEMGPLQDVDTVPPLLDAPRIHNLRLRAAVMLALAWITFVVGECIALTIPTVLGRALIRLVGLPSSHDLHSFGLGFYVLLAALELAYRAHDFLSSVDAATAIRLALPYIFIVVRGLLQWFLWFGLAPLACGMLVELTVTIPLRVSYMESPYFYMYQDWALGLLLIKVWSKIADAGGFGERWRERLERAREGGLLGAGRNFSRTLWEVVGPILVCNVIALAVPHTLTRALLPLLGLSLETSSFVYRYVYIWLLCIYVTYIFGRYTRAGLRALHDSIRDDKYLIGRRLYNYS